MDEELQNELENDLLPGIPVPTTDTSSVEEQTTAPVESTESPAEPVEKSTMQKVFGVGKGIAGTELFDYSGGGFIYGGGQGPVDFYKPGGDFQKVTSAPALGLLDTFTDFGNMITPKGIPDIPKVKPYEEKSYQAIRNIAGLVLPSIALKGMAFNAASKYHASGAMAKKIPWLYNLGNKKSFAWLAERGIDTVTGGFVDYTAKQNERNGTLADQIVEWWPSTDVFVPDYMQTGPGMSADQIKLANVWEGGVFNMLASLAEGFTYIAKNGQSLKRTAKFVAKDGSDAVELNQASLSRNSNTKYSDNIVENKVLEKQADKVDTLRELEEYYQNADDLPQQPTVGLHDVFDADQDLVITVPASNPLGNAKVQAAQVRYNFESTNGRITQIVTEAGRKRGIEIENLLDRTMASELTSKLKAFNGTKYKTNSGKFITDKMMTEAGDHLAATLLHPKVSKEEILGVLDEFKRAVDDSVVRIVGKKGLSKAIKQLKAQMIDLDQYKARAYLVHGDAGAISDMAQGARLVEGKESVKRTVELMADRLEVLMVEKGLASFEANAMLQNMEAWKLASKSNDVKTLNLAAETILDNSSATLSEIIPKAKAWSKTIKSIANENPEFLKPFLLASELADGNVDSLYKLHTWAGENLATWQKLIVDGNPQTPSIINKAIFSNLFNSMLSSPTTPIAAGVGNLTGLLGKSTAQISGAALSGDWIRAKQAVTAWYSLDETFSKATDHMKLVFRKASTNPKEISYTMRSDIAIKETKELTALRAYAEAASKNGEDGAGSLLKMFDDMEDMAADPTLRFGANSMSGIDGFSKSILATSEAKYRALWKASKDGHELTEESFKKAYNEIYDEFIDDKGMLSNIAIDANAREIALNADAPFVDSINTLLRNYPAMRTFIWFPRTTANVLDTARKWSPAGAFSQDWHDLWGANAFKTLDDFKDEEIIQHLIKRGKPVDEFYKETFQTLRYEVKGKAAISSFMMTLGFFAAANDRCTGTGHVNKAVQRAREKKGWKKKSCTNPVDGKQYSYEWMGPIGDWMSVMIDLVDNADVLTTGQTEQMLQKLWIIGANNLQDKRVLTQLEPMFDVLQGNGAAFIRWMSGIANNSIPLGNARTWLGKQMYPELREVRTELEDNLRNRNAWLDAFDPHRALPVMVDPVDGKPVNGDQSWLQRFTNNVTKVGNQISPTNQWLIDIEYPNSPSMNLSNRGVLLEKVEIEAINSIMGKQGLYKKELQKIKRRAENLTYTDADGITYKGFVDILQAARRGNIPSTVLDITKYANVFNDITSAYNKTKRIAENSLSTGTEAQQTLSANIKAREYKLLNKQFNTKTNNLEDLYKGEEQSLEDLVEMFK